MALARHARGRGSGADYWPGFVDAMATLLLVIIFLLSIFMLAQFYLSQEISGRDSALESLKSRIAELTQLLALERGKADDMQATIASLTTSLADMESERDRLAGLLSDAQEGGAEAAGLRAELSEQEKLTAEAQAQVELLNQQLAALRRQLATLEAALDAAEQRDKESQAQIADLGRRLNAALAQKVQELARYRSEFFGRLKEALGNRSDIEVVGDRFVFQSEVLFASASAEINEDGKAELDKVAAAVKDIAGAIPDDINWILRIDGHSDAQPISNAEFPSNWHLSAARAIAVVRYLQERGVPAKRMVAAGFGEYQPLDAGKTADAFRRNRRIEFKLTQR